MAASSNTAGEPKYGLRNDFDGLRIAPPAPVASGQAVYSILHAFDALRIPLPTDGQKIVLPAPAATGQQIYPRESASDGLIIASPALAESSSSKTHPPYDVFINHHGEDVAKNIYKKLDATGLRVFLHNNELKFGDFFPTVLEEAMASASIQIAIFSENYAQSPRCLAELAFILQLPNIKFIPIYYHVEPSTLSWATAGKGIYADAFNKHEMESRYNSERLESWKLALHKASLYTGEIIESQGDEQKVVVNVVNRVLKELKKIRLEHPVGLDEVEQDFHDKIALQSAGPIETVGIWGMGGVGKTTLAKRLYNRKCSTYQRSSFLSDVREAARKGLLYKKQKQLLEDIDFKGHAVFDNVDHGKAILSRHLRSLSVLIVLDDVDHLDQLDALLPNRYSLGYGSLVIITTRDLSVLKAWGISTIYKIGTLNPAHAEQLFCWHAFGRPSPLLEFKELAQKFIESCNGLPLSLKVLGSLLHGESSKNYWQAQLDKLSRIVPHDIKWSLKTSYDALDEEEKEMFLDVACFFIGCTSSRAIAIWEGSGWNGLHGWQRLVNKCLVELDEDNLVRMHKHLRDIGREIANEQSPYRLWSKWQIIKIQPWQQEAIRIRGIANAVGDNCYQRQGRIIINTSQGECSLEPCSLGLKIFVGDGDFINQEHSEISRELVWLQCNYFKHKYFPLWPSLKNLGVLELFDCWNLKDLWERDEDAPSQLRELVIQKCYSLRGLPRYIGQLNNSKKTVSLRSLETLKIRDCPELNGLPGLGEFKFLEEIRLEACYKLEKIEGLEGLRSLKILKISGCSQLNGLPGLEELTSLKEFDMQMCHKLKKVEGLGGLRSLEILKIRDCQELNGLPGLEELTSLKEFDMQMCHKLKKAEGLGGLRSLEILKIRDCQELDGLPGLEELTSLKEFDLQMCHKLKKVEGLRGLRSLEILKIRDCPEIDGLPSLGDLRNLRRLDL